MAEIDPRAVKILFDAFSSSASYREGKSPSAVADDFEYAKRAGVMFDQIRVTHDQIVTRARSAVVKVNRRAVADAFVCSISSRRLELRSALGSFAVLQYLPQHDAPCAGIRCPICGVYNREFVEDLNALNLERFKYGGVRHDNPLYAAMDLELFSRIPPSAPSAADLSAFNSLLQAIRNIPKGVSSSGVQKFLGKVFKSNKNERDIVVRILGLASVLETPTYRGYSEQYVPDSQRHLPPRRFVDMAYPACWWQSSVGVNESAVTYWFGHLPV